jgi:hypothetical protein
MIEVVDNELRARFAPLVDETDDSSWLEIPMPRRRLRTPVAIAAAAALIVAVAAPAVGVPGRVARLFTAAKPAPPEIERTFSEWKQVTGTDLVAAPREVLETPVGPGQTASMWVAPTAGGGRCTLVKIRFRDGSSEGAGGECGPRLNRLSVDVILHGPFTDRGVVLGGPVLLEGFVGQPNAASLRLEFEDGDSASIPFVWMSKPVETAFFVYGVPKRHWRAGHHPTTLTVLSAGGKELAQADITGIP